MRSKAALPALFLVAFAGFLCGCGGGDGGETSAGSNTSSEAVKIVDYKYAPADLTVPAGTTVTFANQDSTGHTATSKRSGAFDSGSIGAGESGQVTLDEPGTFAYYCAFHPFMKGTVTVEE